MVAMMWRKEYWEIFTRWIYQKIAKSSFGRNITIIAKESRLN